MHVITQSLILFLWMQTLTFVRSQGDCTLQQFLKSKDYDENFDTTNLDDSYASGKQVRVSCNVGYSGFFKLICVDGTWQKRGAKCEPKSCGHPGDAQFADFALVQGDDFVFGSQVVYTCHKGYQMVSRSNSRQCMAGGWDGVVPICEAQQCPAIHVDNNVLVTGDPDEATFGNVIRFSCKSNSEILDGPVEIYCDENGAWSGEAPKCKEISCKAPVIENGYVLEEKQKYDEHEVLHFTCNPTFKRNEHRPSKCTKFGSRAEWSPTPLCESIKCRLTHSTLGGATYDPPYRNLFSPGDTLTVTCGKKFWIFELEHTSTVTTCGEDGEWTIRPVCQEVRCSNRRPSHVSYWDVSWGQIITQDMTARYTCQRGYKSPDGGYMATCTRTGWTPDPLCEAIRCDPQSYSDADPERPFKTQYGYNERVRYICKEGYTGQYTLTCGENGWGGSPGCREITCNPQTYNHADPEEQFKSEYKYNEEVRYICKEGYHGEFTIKCGERGWSGSHHCQEIKCDRKDSPNADIDGPAKDEYKNKEKVTYKCNDGGQFTLTCGKTGWVGSEDCTETACTKPSIANGFVVGPINQMVYFACDEDYKLFTKGWWGAAKCDGNEWSVLDRCILKSKCGGTPVIANGEVVEETGQIKCNEGYRAQVDRLTCENGKWSLNGFTPKTICRAFGIHCSPPPKVVNAVVESAPMKEYLSGSYVTYLCRDNYELQGDETIQCKNGIWEEKNTSCTEITCDRKDSPDAFIDGPAKDEYKNKEKVTYKCNDGGQFTLTCGKTGWVGSEDCTALTCDPPPADEWLNVKGVPENGEPILPDRFLTFSCDAPGKFLNGSSKLICGRDGNWDNPFPSCEDITCKVGVMHQDLIVTGLQPGDQTVKTGHKLQFQCTNNSALDGSEEIACLETGEWKPPFPTCTVDRDDRHAGRPNWFK